MAGGLKNGQLKDVEKLVSTTVATRKCTGKWRDGHSQGSFIALKTRTMIKPAE
jgi:hypothetical protein